MRSLVRRAAQVRLSLKLAASSALLTVLVVGVAFFGLSLEIRKNTKRFFTDELHRNQRALLNLQHRRLEQLLWTSTVLTENPTLRAAIETYRSETGGGRRDRAELLETIGHEVEGIMAGLGKDLLVVTDENGRVLAARARRGDAPAAGTDLSGSMSVRRVLDAAFPSDSSAFGVAAFGGVPYQTAYVPITLRGFPIGALILGDRLDRGYVQELRAALGGEVAVAGPRTILAATLPVTAPALGAAAPLDGRGPGSLLAGDPGEEQEYVVAALPLGAGPAGEPISLFLLQPLDPVLAPLNRDLYVGFLFYATGAVLLVGLGAGIIGRSLLRPLSQFVRYMETVAATGDPATRFDPRGATVEVERLNTTYEHLMDSLDQKRQQLEQRGAELAQANVELHAEIVERERVERALGESEAQLRQSQKLEAVGTLAGGVAHDFNNLLTVIISYADLVLTQSDDESPTRADLMQIKDAALRAASLTKQLLAFSRRQVLQPKVIDLSLIVDGIHDLLRRMIGEDIELRAQSQPLLPRVKADPGQIEQVIMNLAVNARDAMPQGGTLTIETAAEYLAPGDARLRDMMPPGDWVRISVRDTGVGIDEQVQARIFEPFFTTKEPGKGTGLGLSTVYGIVKQSGGFIWVTSKLGAGTTFDVYLPPVEGAVSPQTPPPPSVASGKETVLLVEDETPVRLLARRCLELYGYRVLESGNSRDAFDVARRHDGRIDLLLTDVVMPQGSGRELAERLQLARPDLKILYMSGYTDDAIVRRGGVGPGTELLEKPFTPEDLARRVRQILDRPRTLDDAVSAAS